MIELADAAERQRILTELDRSLVIEAAAGSGKTTMLVQRLVALLAAGQCQPGTLAVMTFTRKAAAELRGRFHAALESALLAHPEDRPRQRRLTHALDHLDRGYIGTIHGFCSRLLRERPIEAGVPLGFTELDDEEDDALRQQGWEEFVRLRETEFGPQLAAVGLRLGQLRDAFERFAHYGDVETWPATAVARPELAKVCQAWRDYQARLETYLPELPADPGNDQLMPLLRQTVRLAAITDFDQPSEVYAFLERFRPLTTKALVQKNWPDRAGQPGADWAKEELSRWNAFCANVVEPALGQWRAYRYPVAIRVLQAATQFVAERRLAAGRLNYQDLLLGAARLLRHSTGLRRYLRQRYTHLLVDEFQDTDPVQAEVLLLLTAREIWENDWRCCTPAPGALCVVGDPQQSIYRFRRADIVTYERVKTQILAGGGGLVRLTTNFRSVPALVNWINATFAGLFPATATAEAAAHQPMAVGRSAADRPLPGPALAVIELPPAASRNHADLVRVEARFIARTIHHALVADRADPADFMIVTRAKLHLSLYGQALAELGIPHQVAGGSAVNDLPELRMLYQLLLAARRPRDPLACVAVLRGPLCGFSDRELFAYRQSGGQFAWLTEQPTAPRWREAFDLLRTTHAALRRLPLAAAAVVAVRAAGLAIRARLESAAALGCLVKALELLRHATATQPTTAAGMAYLRQLLNRRPTHDGLALVPGRSGGPGVRVMNLHKVKGLEARVVFLADPRSIKDWTVELTIDRSGPRSRGFMSIQEEVGWPRQVLAHPLDWDSLASAESKFVEAENIRLAYVAATRAQQRLIVTLATFKRAADAAQSWGIFADALADAPRLEQPADPKEPAPRPGQLPRPLRPPALQSVMPLPQTPDNDEFADQELEFDGDIGNMFA